MHICLVENSGLGIIKQFILKIMTPEDLQKVIDKIEKSQSIMIRIVHTILAVVLILLLMILKNGSN